MRRRLLVGHFLRRFLDNDLVSPHADRHEVVTMTLAGLGAFGLVLSALLSMKYLMRPLQSRGWTIIASLDDTFAWCGLSMVIMAIVALATWDALSLDSRDTEVLGPLPLERRTIAWSQVTALVLFASAFTVALNAIPSLVVPVLRIQRLPVDLAGVLTSILAHATATTAAGLFGFASVFALRETLRAVLGHAGFQRISAAVQGSLVVLLASAFLLMPVSSSGVGQAAAVPSPVWSPPPLWFVGLNDRIAGHVLADLPATALPIGAVRRQVLSEYETRRMALYREREPVLARLASTALWALAGVLLIGAAACAWNNRRLPGPATVRARPRTNRAIDRAARWLAGRDPLARAGFTFAIHALTRSATHRVSLATTVGAALAGAVITLHGLDLSAGGAEMPAMRVFAVQALVLAVLAAGFRHATRIPAELDAAVTFPLSGAVDARRFVRGVARAAVVALGLPAIALLLPAHAVVIGPPLALRHAAFGVLLLLVLVELLFYRVPGLPFVTVHEPEGSKMLAGPLYALIAVNVVGAVATLERVVIADASSMAALLAATAAAWVALRVSSGHGVDGASLMSAVPPAGLVQRLNLNE